MSGSHRRSKDREKEAIRRVVSSIVVAVVEDLQIHLNSTPAARKDTYLAMLRTLARFGYGIGSELVQTCASTTSDKQFSRAVEIRSEEDDDDDDDLEEEIDDDDEDDSDDEDDDDSDDDEDWDDDDYCDDDDEDDDDE